MLVDPSGLPPDTTHKRSGWLRLACDDRVALDHRLARPRDGSGQADVTRAIAPERIRAPRAPEGSKRNRSAGNGIQNPAHPVKTTRATKAADNHELSNERGRASGR